MPLPIEHTEWPAARRTAFLGLLTAQAVALSALESMLPALPFLPPGGKAGFSNIITMYAASSAGLPAALTIAFLKSLFVLLTRGGTAFLMSLAGGVVSTLLMALLLKSGRFGLIGVGVGGALGHNLAQFFVAVWLTGTPAIAAYLPVLLLFSLFSGTVTGFLLYLLLPALLRQERAFGPN